MGRMAVYPRDSEAEALEEFVMDRVFFLVRPSGL